MGRDTLCSWARDDRSPTPRNKTYFAGNDSYNLNFLYRFKTSKARFGRSAPSILQPLWKLASKITSLVPRAPRSAALGNSRKQRYTTRSIYSSTYSPVIKGLNLVEVGKNCRQRFFGCFHFFYIRTIRKKSLPKSECGKCPNLHKFKMATKMAVIIVAT